LILPMQIGQVRDLSSDPLSMIRGFPLEGNNLRLMILMILFLTSTTSVGEVRICSLSLIIVAEIMAPKRMAAATGKSTFKGRKRLDIILSQRVRLDGNAAEDRFFVKGARALAFGLLIHEEHEGLTIVDKYPRMLQ
jgi:hypothetical protein